MYVCMIVCVHACVHLCVCVHIYIYICIYNTVSILCNHFVFDRSFEFRRLEGVAEVNTEGGRESHCGTRLQQQRAQILKSQRPSIFYIWSLFRVRYHYLYCEFVPGATGWGRVWTDQSTGTTPTAGHIVL
jgi:hypothetical protein